MLRNVLCLISSLICGAFIQAQPSICPPGAAMAANCNQACIICNIDGFIGYNEGNEGGQPPPGYCTFAVHDVEWIGFIAGTTDLSLQVSVSNCNGGGGNGLEAGIYLGIDCQNYSLVSNCETNINNNASVVLTNTTPLVVGQYYWLVMDSNGGNACDFQVNVVSGSTAVPPPSPIPAIFGNTSTCPGATVNYAINPVPGAPQVNWTLNGAPVGTGENIAVSFPVAGNYQLCAEASNACFPPVSLCTNILVTPITPTSEMATICLGDCFITGNGTSLCTPGIFPFVFNSFAGCDSTVNYIIDVILPTTTLVTDTICEGQSITIGAEEYTTTGVHTVLLPNYQGCDSTVVLNLLVEDSLNTIFNVEICEGETYPFGSETYSAAGVYQQVLVSQQGCDSIITLNLALSPNDSTYLTESICEGESFSIGNSVFNQTGSFEVILQNSQGCDSTIYLGLSVYSGSTTNLNQEICEGESFFVGNEEFTTSGNYSVFLANIYGCDSIVNLNLNVVQALTENLNEQICNGQSFFVGNETFSTSGIYEVTLPAFNGCDSIINLNLQVLTVLETTLTASICEGEVFEVGSEAFTTSGNFQIDLVSFSGCDSIVYLELEIFPLVEYSILQQICAGDSIQMGGLTFTQTGSYTVISPSPNGCDTTVNLDLSVYPNLNTFLYEDICEGDGFSVGGQTFTNTGIYEIGLSTANGCDSLVILELDVFPVIETMLTIEICAGQTFAVGPMVFDQSGLYEVTMTGLNGCDSIVFLDLLVGNQIITALNEAICFGETFAVGGLTFEETGFFEIPFFTADGCDSLVQLNLEVADEVLTQLSETICSGESYFVDGQAFNATGQFEVTLLANSGCDSMVALNLTVLEEIVEPLVVQICEGQSYSVGNQLFDQTGNYTVMLVSNYGCDSIVLFDLEVSDFLQTNLTENICEGETFQIGSTIFDSTGFYEVEFTTTNGCDSIVSLDLTVAVQPETYLFESICEGESFPIGNQSFGQSGLFEVVLLSVSGCDSTVVLDLEVLEILTESLLVEICNGESYGIGNQSFTQAGTYQVILNATNGCDSIVNLNLSVSNCNINATVSAAPVNCFGDFSGSLEFTVTNGNAPFEYQWEELSTGTPSGNGVLPVLNQTETIGNLPAGNYSVSVTSSDGYSQVYPISIFEPPMLEGNLLVSEFGSFNLPCFDDQSGFVESTISGGIPPYQYLWASGENTPTLENVSTGEYVLTVSDSNNCPLELSTELISPNPISWSLEATLPNCFAPFGSIAVSTIQGGSGSYLYSIDNGPFSPLNLFTELSIGTHSIVVTDANACQIDTLIFFQPPPQPVLSIGNDTSINLGDELQFSPIVFPFDVQFQWEGDALSCNTCPSPVVNPSSESEYQLTITTSDGCTATDGLKVFVEKKRRVFTPNAFSPNGDGINDYLVIFGGSEVKLINSFTIFSRWGESVFEYYNFPPNTIEFGWDGTHRGEKMKPAVFLWMSEVEFIDGEIMLFRGEVTLVK